MRQRIVIPELDECATVDPGRKTGIAFWDGTFFPSTTTISYKDAIKKSLSKYIAYMTDSFYDLLDTHNTYYKFIQIEGVEVWGSSSKSMASATSGDLIILSYLVGAYVVVAQEFTKEVQIKTAPQWKGQLSKEGTAARVKRINKLTYENDHITDAVAMGFANVEEIWLLKRGIK